MGGRPTDHPRPPPNSCDARFGNKHGGHRPPQPRLGFAGVSIHRPFRLHWQKQPHGKFFLANKHLLLCGNNCISLFRHKVRGCLTVEYSASGEACPTSDKKIYEHECPPTRAHCIAERHKNPSLFCHRCLFSDERISGADVRLVSEHGLMSNENILREFASDYSAAAKKNGVEPIPDEVYGLEAIEIGRIVANRSDR
jgi:hypothetical protein